MRRVLFILFMGATVLVGGCAGTDIIRPPTDPPGLANLSVSLSNATETQPAGVFAVLADAIDRLVPALGPPGAALGAPLRQLRDGDQLNAALIDATVRQLAALERILPPERGPDAEALEVALAALRAAAAK